MGGPKALLLWEGETLLQRAVRLALAAGCQPVVAVVGDWDPGPLPPTVHIILNPEATEGMASSIRAGVAALPDQAEAVLLLTVDQIRVNEALLRELLRCFRNEPDRPVACAYANTVGIPAVLPRRLFPALMALQGDHGAKAILLQDDTLPLPFPGGADDLDTPQDEAAFKQ
jgi:molybdenum cofactor cytidylyltransferase